MSQTAWSKLRALLVANYDHLVRRVGRRLGSSDLAIEAVHEAFLRIERGGDINEVANPDAYLYRMTLNIAAERHSAEKLRANAGDADLIQFAPDQTPGADRALEGKEAIALLESALGEMPERRRAIFIALWVHGAGSKELAAHFGLTQRMIQIEIKAALKHCLRRLKHALPDAVNS